MPDRIGQQLGHYRLIKFLGRGGFAEVYLGEHVHLGTQVAVKILFAYLDAANVEQFRNEAQIIAHFEHPHIVRVFDFGIEDGIPYFVMSYASGGTLRQRHPRGTRISLATVISYVNQIAPALQYAHFRKRIHRDVKPENMLIGRNHEILLSDFGISITAHSTLTREIQDASGTPTYMAPEHFLGQAEVCSDQYSLGVLVYEWLCGEPPFTKGDMGYQHTHVPPPSIRNKIPSLSPLIEQVVMRALEKDPHKRFVSVQAFSKALEQASQFKQFPLGTTLLTYRGHSGGANTLKWSPDSTRIVSSSDTTVQMWNALTGDDLYIYKGHLGRIYVLAWSPDSTRIVSSSWDDETVQIWDANTGELLLTYKGHSSWVSSLAWSPDSRHIVSSSCLDGTMQIWDAMSGSTLRTYEAQGSLLNSVAWSPDSSRIAAVNGKTVQIWDATSVMPLLTYEDNFITLAWSPDSSRIAAANGKTVQIWDAASGTPLLAYEKHSDKVETLAWSPDGKRIASAGDHDGTQQVWDANTGELLLTYKGHYRRTWNAMVQSGQNALAWSPDGSCIVSCSRDDKTVQIWNSTTGTTLYSYQGHSNEVVRAVAWSPDGTRIASASYGVKVWRAT